MQSAGRTYEDHSMTEKGPFHLSSLFYFSHIISQLIITNCYPSHVYFYGQACILAQDRSKNFSFLVLLYLLYIVSHELYIQ